MTRIAAILLTLTFAGCGTSVQTAQPNVQGPVENATARVQLNATNVRCSYAPEWQFNRSGSPDAPPEFGVALSGGGMRAAAYSMGALSALNDLGYLKKADVISAASGGAYAAGWYLTQKAATNATDDELFRDCDLTNAPAGCVGPYQHHLADHGRIINRRRATFALATDTVMFPVNLLVNGLFGWHENTTGHRRFYERALVSEFFTAPGTHRQLRYSFEDLRSISATKKLPLLIVNTTAAIDDDQHHYGADLRRTVYELSPARYGSDAFGYASEAYPMDLPRAVSVSGAAADLSVLASGNVQKTLLSALNLDLGYFIDNRNRFRQRSPDSDDCIRFPPPAKNPHFTARKWTFRAVPFPAYAFIPYWSKDAKGLRTYLSDGGHSENLAAFSLIRRLVRNIVIVDASGDRNFQFNDYLQLQNAVLESLNAKFEVPAIEAVLSLKEEDRRRIISAQPVMTGSVRYFPFPNEPENARTLNIVYVKLSYDAANAASKYTGFPQVTSYQSHHEKTFPFQGLFDQAYSPQQYRAYRDLAYITMINDTTTIRGRIKD